MPLAYLIWNEELVVSEWNPAAEHVFGWSETEAIGRNLCDLIVPPSAQQHVKLVWSDLKDGGDWSAHSINENMRKDETRLVYE